MSAIPVRLGVQQRVLPNYRAPFFDALASACPPGVSVFAGLPRPEEAIETRVELTEASLSQARNVHLGRGSYYLCFQRGLLSWLKEWDPGALIVEANPRYLSTPAGVRWMRSCGRPVIGWGLGAPASGGAFSGMRAAARRAFLSQFDVLVTYSQQGAQEYQQLGFSAEQVFVAPNAAARRPAHPIPVRPLTALPHQLTLLFVGRLQARKRVDLLLRACQRLPEELRPHLWVVGDGPERASLEKTARDVYPRARFLGARHGAELERLFVAADLFVLPGTGGLAVQQAMSFGLPVMVAEADGTQTDLVRPANGWQLPPGDVDTLVQSLSDALSDTPKLRRMGNESYRIASEEINLEHMVEVFARAVEAAQERSKRRRG